MPLGVASVCCDLGSELETVLAWDCSGPELCEALLCSEPAGWVMPSSLEGTWLVRRGLAANSFGALRAREVAHVCGFDESLHSLGTPVLTIV